ncbi:MAG: hypothetical protein AAGB28_19765 [Pseudomonadota bacterium]
MAPIEKDAQEHDGKSRCRDHCVWCDALYSGLEGSTPETGCLEALEGLVTQPAKREQA